MMNFSNCSLECGSSTDTKEAAEFYLEKVGIIIALSKLGNDVHHESFQVGVPLVGSLGLIGNMAAIMVLR